MLPLADAPRTVLVDNAQRIYGGLVLSLIHSFPPRYLD